jgi:agmatine/peptidylarginine deiminase
MMELCRVASTIAAAEGIPVVKTDMVLEGGSVHTDGEGWAAHALRCKTSMSSLSVRESASSDGWIMILS